jgi:hypothetical protein
MAALALLGVGVVLGALFDAPLMALLRRLRPADGDEQPAHPKKGFGPDATGWFEAVRRPGGATAAEALERIDDLGYMESYETGGDEVGVTVYDRARVDPGTNLIVSAHEPTVLLLDMEGELLHEWRIDFDAIPKPDGWEPLSPLAGRFIRRARLMEGGALLCLFERTVFVKVDVGARPIWADFDMYHHDIDVAADGTIYTLTHDVRVIPRIHATRKTFEDFVVTLSPDGRVLDRFSLLEAFERSPYAPLLERLPEREDVFHTNTLELIEGESVFGANKLLISVWGLDAVAVVDLETRVVEWAVTGQWHHQHQPVLLEGGEILLFDNLGHGDYSKVIQFDPFTQRVSWSYEGDAENDFYSMLIGSCQRLENGNTLITESLSGRAFEVTPAGEVVWRWSSPFRAGPKGEGVAVLMELVRLPPIDPGAW